MGTKRKEGTFASASGLADIYYRSWRIDQPKAAVQIVHGMAEHGERYAAFAQALNDAGFDVWAMDLTGHGNTADEDDLGYFGPDRGWRTVVTDINEMVELMLDDYPPAFPIFLFGHSMGSFLARAYCQHQSKRLAGAVFCGTSAPNPAAGVGILAAKLVIAFKGEKHRSTLLDSVAFGNYNNKYGKPRTKFDWLNTDEAEVDNYIADPLCGFLFTAKGFDDLFSLLQSVSDKDWFTSMPYQFPMLLIAGGEDPVGNYGKGVELVARRLRDAGSNRTQCQIYPGMRHEILLEPQRHLVYETVIDWLNKALESAEETR